MDITHLTRRLSNMSDGSIYDILEDEEEDFGEHETETSSVEGYGPMRGGKDKKKKKREKKGKGKEGSSAGKRAKREKENNPVAELEKFEKLAGSNANDVLLRQSTLYFHDSSDEEVPSEGEQDEKSKKEKTPAPKRPNGGKPKEGRGRKPQVNSKRAE